MSHADDNVLSLFVHICPSVSSQNARAQMEKPEPACAFASVFPTQMFGDTQETGHCANTVPHLCLCLSSNISNWFEAMNFLAIITIAALSDIVDSWQCFYKGRKICL